MYTGITEKAHTMLQTEELKSTENILGSVSQFLSRKGNAIKFPKEGIMAQAQDAKGKEINATIGMACEDDGSPMRLQSIANKILLNPSDVFTYASSFGRKALRVLWREKMLKSNPSLSEKISLPLPTNALTHALSVAGYLFLDKGQSIIVPNRYWGNYRLIFEKGCEAELDMYNMFDAGKLDMPAFERKISEGSGKKIILLNFPNNPSGYSPTTKEAEEITRVITRQAEKDKIVVICDDAYFGLAYKEEVYKESLFSMLADAHENILAVKIDGVSKEDYAWGLRVGFVTYGSKGMSPKEYSVLEDKTAAVVRGSISNVAHISQSLIEKALVSADYSKEKEEKRQILKKRFLAVENSLRDVKYSLFFTPLPHNSGYFLCVRLHSHSPEAVRQVLLEKYDTGVIALKDSLRISFASVPEAKIQKLFKNIYNACKNMG